MNGPVTGLSGSTLEYICLGFSILLLILGFARRRSAPGSTIADLFAYLMLGIGLVSVEYMKDRDRARALAREAQGKKS